MEPISAGVGIVGLGMQLYGGYQASQTAKEINQHEQQIFALEKQINAQRKNAMELSARRQSMEVYRNIQRMRSQGLASAVAQGAQFGSGFYGGQANTQSAGSWNLLGIGQNLEIGRNIFGLSDQITDQRAAISSLKGEMAEEQSWSSLGGALMQNAGTIGNVAGYAGSQVKSAMPGTGYAGPYV